MGCDSLDVKVLARIELNGGQQDKSSAGRILINDLDDLVCGKDWAIDIFGLNQHHSLVGVEFVVSDLRLDCVLGLAISI